MFISYVAFVFKYLYVELGFFFLDLCFVEGNNMVAIGEWVDYDRNVPSIIVLSFLFICLGTHVFVVQLHTIKLNKCFVYFFFFHVQNF